MLGVWTVLPDGSLRPDEPTLKATRRQLSPGLQVEGRLDLDRPRSLPQHRRYFARLSEVAASIPEHVVRQFWAAVVEDLAVVGSIDPEILHDAVKRIQGVSSIAFRRMDQDDARRFYEMADQLLDWWLARAWGGA